MIIVFNCPSCGASLRMKDKYGGQRGRCPHCQSAITVPAIAIEDGDDLIPLDGPAPHDTPQPQDTPRSASLFSLGDRAAPRAAPTSGPQPAPRVASAAGDSNIGLAPIEERVDKPGAASAKPLPAVAPAAKSAPPGDSDLRLAPMDDAAAPEKAPPVQPAPQPKAAPATAPDDPDFGLAPLEDAVAAKAGSAPAAKADSQQSAKFPAAAAAAAAEDRSRVVCTSCHARIKVPPKAAGREFACPRCKTKLRAPEAAKASPNETATLSDTAGSGQDLGLDMLDVLGDGGNLNSAEGTAANSAPLSQPKLPSKKAKAGSTLLGMPPLVVYLGAGGLALAIVGVIVVVLFSGGGKTASPPLIAQTPAGAQPSPAASQPAVPSPGSAPTPAQPAGKAPDVSAPASAGVNPAMPAATPSVPGSAPAAAPPAVDWRSRLPVVQMLSPPPAFQATNSGTGVELAGAENDEVQAAPAKVVALQTQLTEALKPMTDAGTAQQGVAQWAELTAQGMEQLRRLKRRGDITGGLISRGQLLEGMRKEEATVGPMIEQLQRVAQLPNVLPILEKELQSRAAREPQGALAAALGKGDAAAPAP